MDELKVLSASKRKLKRVNTNESGLYLFASQDHFSHKYCKNFSSREDAHAQTKCQDNSTSGRGARASYQTMLPEISARRSLLGEPRFRYLSPGSEGEKCRPLDHL